VPARAVSSPVAVVLLVLVAVAAAVAVGATTADLPVRDTAPRHVSVSASADATGSIALTHDAGPALDVRNLRVQVVVDGEPLARQPPVPFFSARGFVSGPTGPFNPAADPEWSAGETAGFRVAGTNSPALAEGATVEVTLYVDDHPVTTVETTVEPPPQIVESRPGAVEPPPRLAGPRPGAAGSLSSLVGSFSPGKPPPTIRERWRPWR
jgi:hypothetical protein